jgi:VIT1/CCC1 family predicted Fe2+/Mn2+ transporter
MSRTEHAYYALKMASLLCALVAALLALFRGEPLAIKVFGGLAAGLGMLAAYFNARHKREAKDRERGEIGPD